MQLRRSTRIILAVLALLVIVIAGGIFWLLTVPAPLEHMMQARVERALSDHFQREVRLENMHVTLIPVFRVTADSFALPNRQPDQPPLIAIKHFTAEANPLELLRTPIHVSSLYLVGLVIKIAPKGEKLAESPKPRRRLHLANFVIDRVLADGTLLYILPKDPDSRSHGV